MIDKDDGNDDKTNMLMTKMKMRVITMITNIDNDNYNDDKGNNDRLMVVMMLMMLMMKFTLIDAMIDDNYYDWQ